MQLYLFEVVTNRLSDKHMNFVHYRVVSACSDTFRMRWIFFSSHVPRSCRSRILQDSMWRKGRVISSLTASNRGLSLLRTRVCYGSKVRRSCANVFPDIPASRDVVSVMRRVIPTRVGIPSRYTRELSPSTRGPTRS